MTPDHRSFEIQCTLAAGGNLEPAEMEELREHCRLCTPCRDRLADFAQLGAQLFLTNALKTPRHRMPQGMRERFLAQAACEGIPLRERSPVTGLGALGLATATLLLLAWIAVSPVASRFAFKTTQGDMAAQASPAMKQTAAAQTVPVQLPAKEAQAKLHSGSRRVAPLAHQTSPSNANRDRRAQVPETGSDAADLKTPVQQFALSENDWHGLTHAYHFSAPREPLEGRQLVAYEHPPLPPLHFRTSPGSTPVAEIFDQNADPGTFRTAFMPYFKADPAAFPWTANFNR